MEKIGSIVSVSTKGICKIENIKKDAFDGAVKGREYYVLKPVSDVNNMFIYIPTDTKLKVRALLTNKEATNIVDTFSKIEEVSIGEDEDRIKTYMTIAKDGDAVGWARLLKTLQKRKNKLPKKLINYQEQSLLSMVKECLISELSTVLDVSKQDIESKLELDKVG